MYRFHSTLQSQWSLRIVREGSEKSPIERSHVENWPQLHSHLKVSCNLESTAVEVNGCFTHYGYQLDSRHVRVPERDKANFKGR